MGDNHLIVYLVLFGAAWGTVVVATPILRMVALGLGVLDVPDPRKVHRNPTPYLGGVGFYFAFMLCLTLVAYWYPHLWHQRFTALAIAATILVLMALTDDIMHVAPPIKMAIEIGIAIYLYSAGFRIDSIAGPVADEIHLGWFGIVVTVLWIVGLINAINFCDVLDGLSSGIVCIAAASLFLVAFQTGHTPMAILMACLVGVTSAFLLYNFAPAKIFMGDTGALFLGLILSAASIISSKKGVAAISLLVPAVAISVPVLDTTLTFIRRLQRKTRSGFWMPDKAHVYHRIANLGIDQRVVVVFCYYVCFCLGVLAYVLSAVDPLYVWLILVLVGSGMVVGVLFLNFVESRIEESFRRGVDHGARPSEAETVEANAWVKVCPHRIPTRGLVAVLWLILLLGAGPALGYLYVRGDELADSTANSFEQNARAALDVGDYSRVVRVCSGAIESTGGAPMTYALAHFMRAQGHGGRDEFDKALADLDTANAIWAQTPWLMEDALKREAEQYAAGLGRELLELQKPQAALRAYSAAALGSGNPVDYLYRLSSELLPEQRRQIWPAEPYLVVAGFCGAEPNPLLPIAEERGRTILDSDITGTPGENCACHATISLSSAQTEGRSWYGVRLAIPIDKRSFGIRFAVRTKSSVRACIGYWFPVDGKSAATLDDSVETDPDGRRVFEIDRPFHEERTAYAEQVGYSTERGIINWAGIEILSEDATEFAMERIELYLPSSVVEG